MRGATWSITAMALYYGLNVPFCGNQEKHSIVQEADLKYKS